MSLMDANGHGSSRRQPFGATEGFTPFDLRTPRWDHAAEAEWASDWLEAEAGPNGSATSFLRRRR
jgi:hypothetical protein